MLVHSVLPVARVVVVRTNVYPLYIASGKIRGCKDRMMVNVGPLCVLSVAREEVARTR